MALGLSQLQFGELIGVTYQQVHKYEHGINSVSAGRLYDIARGTGTPVAYFFEGLEKTEGTPLHQAKLLDVMRSLGEMQDEKLQRAIGQLVRSLAGN